LLLLDGERFVVEDGFWVKFEARRVATTPERPHGLDYSLTLHDGEGERFLGRGRGDFETERSNAMKTLKIGVLSREKYKARTMAIARGKYVPAKDEPKIWFESVRSMGQVLSEENQALLKLILETEPQSMVELAKRSGRAASNLSRTLRTMERYGLVHFEQGENRQLAPRVDYSGVAFEMSF
jgi:predicted transcriptional regulator